MGEIFVDPCSHFHFKNLALASSTTENIDENESERGVDLYFGIGYIPYFYIDNPFNGLSNNERYVPPHPNDKNSSTKPVKITNNYSMGRGFIGGLYADAGLSFTPLMGIKNRFSFLPAFPYLHDGFGKNPVQEGPYQYPPINRQQYSSGENAFTFISVGHIFTNDLSFVVSPKINDGPWIWQIDLEIGYNLTGIEHLYGWDRHAKIEFNSSTYHLHHGLHIGAHFTLYDSYRAGDDVQWRFHFLGASYSLSTTSIQTVALDLLGFEIKF